MADELHGLKGIVTGAAGGLGRAFAQALRDAGARVAVFDVDGAAAERAAQELGASAIGLGVDVTDQPGVMAAVARTNEEFGQIDFLLNNAGVRHEAPFLEHGLDDWRRTVDVNLTGPFVCAQAVANVMVEQGGGAIVNVASIAGLLAFRTRPAYVASKAGLMGLTRAIAVELADRGVRCNAIAPGILETPLTNHFFENPEMAETIRTGSPTGRWGQTDDMVGAAVFLCGPHAGYVNGATFVIDGGWTAGKGY